MSFVEETKTDTTRRNRHDVWPGVNKFIFGALTAACLAAVLYYVAPDVATLMYYSAIDKPVNTALLLVTMTALLTYFGTRRVHRPASRTLPTPAGDTKQSWPSRTVDHTPEQDEGGDHIFW